MRLFIAINFSDEIRSVLNNTVEILKKQCISANFTLPQNFHITLAFLGEILNPEPAKKILNSIKAEPFVITMSGCGKFGDLWWAGLEQNSSLSRIANSIQDILLKNKFNIDTKPFKPHITLARQVVAKDRIMLDVPRTSMIVNNISLIRSDRINGKIIYTEIFRKDLAGADKNE